MKSPSPILRGLFVCAVGSLLVSVMFSINNWPAAQLFSIIGALGTVTLYSLFNRKTIRRSNYARHLLLIFLVAAIVLKSFEIAAGGWFFLAAFMAFLVWFTWSVLEELPPKNDEP